MCWALEGTAASSITGSASGIRGSALKKAKGQRSKVGVSQRSLRCYILRGIKWGVWLFLEKMGLFFDFQIKIKSKIIEPRDEERLLGPAQPSLHPSAQWRIVLYCALTCTLSSRALHCTYSSTFPLLLPFSFSCHSSQLHQPCSHKNNQPRLWWCPIGQSFLVPPSFLYKPFSTLILFWTFCFCFGVMPSSFCGVHARLWELRKSSPSPAFLPS